MKESDGHGGFGPDLDPDNQRSSTSTQPTFAEVLQANASRRAVLASGAALGLGSFFQISTAAASTEGTSNGLLNFKAIPRANAKGIWYEVSDDYTAEPLLPWGDPLQSDGEPFSLPLSAVEQEVRIGTGHDGMWLFPRDERSGVLCLNHEYGPTPLIIGKQAPMGIGDVRAVQHAHGVSVLDLAADDDGNWHFTGGERTRRVHGNTPVRFSGPAANSALLDLQDRPEAFGTLNNCGSGYTPWGTYVTCEENFQGYFGVFRDREQALTAEQQRYGMIPTGFGYGWHVFDARFDLSDADTPFEENRFGWVVEIDPMDPNHVPVKHTSLGRFKHESCTVVIGKDNRAVAYMGDDQGFDYIYKFVSSGDYEAMLAEGRSPLSEGTLYVARFNDDNTGEWLELSTANPALEERFSTQDEIVTYARIAGDTVGATPMDRPEWVTAAPDGQIYCALTNNGGRREGNAANPTAPNVWGHIVRWHDTDSHVGTAFTWDIFKLAADSIGTEESFGSPDSIWIDPDGRLFIGTDGRQEDDMNNQLLVCDTHTGEIRRLFVGVQGCEITGITTSPDRTALFVNIQHPGTQPEGNSFPRLGDFQVVARDATIMLRRKDRGIVGS